MLDGERLAVGELAVAVAVAIPVAEAVEQRPRGGGIVDLGLRLVSGIVARDVGGNGTLRRHRPVVVEHVDEFVDVECHADRTPQRDLLRRVAADHGIFHVEIRPPGVRPQE